LALDEMDYFYGSSEKALLDLPVKRFWGKYRNMQIVKLQDKMDLINSVNIAQSPEGQSAMNNLTWKLDELKGEERVDSLKDLKAKFGKKKKSKGKLKGKN